MAHSSDLPFWMRGNFAPVSDEITAHELPVAGELPAGLAGTYLRNGPNPKSGVSRHWWFGNGMLHGVRIAGGQARWYRNRYVQTAPPIAGELRIDRLRRGGASNTSVIEHGGRVLSMVESSFPVELDRELGTVGVFDFDGQLDTPMAAHPKRCPLTGELHFIGYQPVRPYLTYHVADREGRLVSRREIDVAGPSLMHDFAITEHHALVFDSPARMVRDWGEGGMPFEWSDRDPARIGVVPRAGGALRWFDIEPGHLSHTANAFERDGAIVLDGSRQDRFPEAPPFLHRWELDLGSGTTRERRLDRRVLDFPRIDERRTGLPHRYTYAVELPDFLDDAPQRAPLIRYDLVSGEAVASVAGIASEHVFVPARAGAAEDEGWVIGFAHDPRRDASELVVLDARAFGAPPIARVQLPRRVPYGFHGTWIPS